jgi:hypothetical protein
MQILYGVNMQWNLGYRTLKGPDDFVVLLRVSGNRICHLYLNMSKKSQSRNLYV